MNKHLFTFVLCGLIIFASTNICRADNKSTSEGLNTVRFFYEKYIQFRVEEYYATTKVPTDDMACQYRKRKYDILEEFCVDDIVKKQEAEDSNGTQIDLILDDTDVDEISLSSLTVAYCGSHYTVGFQTHSFAFDKTSPITNVELKVWTTDDGKKISNVSGRNLSGIDSYKISPVASVSPENVIVNSCNLTKGDWMFVDSKDNNIVSAAMNFSSTIMTLRINGKKYQNYRYYLSMSEPNKFDGQQVGTASKGGYLVLCGTEFNEFFFLGIKEFDANKGKITLYNPNIDFLDASSLFHFKREIR